MHYAAGRVAILRGRRTALCECLLVGAVLPDLPSKLFDMLFELEWAAIASHTPLLWAVMAYGLAHVFAERLRPSAFLGLLLGGWLHILVDLGKDNMGFGVIMLAFPLSWKTYGLGLYYPENSLSYAPWCLGAVLVGEWIATWRPRPAPPGAA
jgi:hypothetical protein